MEKRSGKLFAVRRALKRRKPFFLRTDGHKRAKLAQNWRKPRGIHNKMRLKKRGYRRSVSVGWKSPRQVHGLDRSGLCAVLVNNPAMLERLNPEAQCIIIAKSVGTRKRVVIAQAAVKRRLSIVNLKDPEAYVKGIEESFKKQKEEKAKRAKEKEKKEEGKKKEAEKKEEKKTIETIADEETRKEEEKKEKDRLLTQKV